MFKIVKALSTESPLQGAQAGNMLGGVDDGTAHKLAPSWRAREEAKEEAREGSREGAREEDRRVPGRGLGAGH